VPHKIRHNLSAAAQFIENFKHRKTVTAAMSEAFAPRIPPTDLHRFLAELPALPLWVHAWYDDLPQQALAQRPWRNPRSSFGSSKASVRPSISGPGCISTMPIRIAARGSER
jgi:hypothetical protein